MKKLILLILTSMVLIMCTKQEVQNPFFSEWKTPYGIAPFDQISEEHYVPAFKKGMEDQLAAIEKITANPEAPTFVNTIEALEKSDPLLTNVSYVFFNLNSANTNDTMQAINKEITPLLSKHNDDRNLNPDLFQRVKTLYDTKDGLGLTGEQTQLLTDYYKGFVRGGANLSDENKAKFREINGELSVLAVQFGENVLKEDNAFEMVLENEEDLAGLPESVRNAAAEAAKEKGYEGKWLFTPHKPSWIPFLTFSERRDLREKLYGGYINRGDNNNEFDNKKIIAKMVNLRIRKANLLGYETHSHFVLEERMAKTPGNVYNLLNKIWPPALKMAKKERAMMQKMIDKDGGDFKLAASDWWYYAEKIRKEKFDLNEDEIRPYLKIDNVISGSFILAEKLFGLSFEERTDIPKYHEDVKTYVVKEADGTMVGVYLSDWFYRGSKRGGAWMNSFRKQSAMDGKKVLPIIYNVGNFTKPTADAPSLLSLDEANTLFHEFGHALHGLLSDCTYPSISGTSVPRDFVEFPSQVLENWVLEPEMLNLYAKHYQTGEIMPASLIEKIEKAGKFNQGFTTVEYMAAALLDMAYHTLTNEDPNLDINKFEKKVLDDLGLIPEIISRYRTTYFRHITGGYSSGYYSYIWSEIMDADTFGAFKEKGIFDKETADSYRNNILAKGGTVEAMEMFKNFRGREPETEPLLKKRGLK
ncbi:MAG: M3 family peptidase [Calditrichaeota bacterium]|nr:MAG: M3 family peptidase [Calditrichota bacterium]MBL1203817.1 M3 family peptidase [Calditrichota bacterium]NOG43647.1 M3 family metallopeptidase [Calditrichota bacterium]